MKKFTLTLFVTLLAGIQLVLAQDIRVTGKVSNASGESLPGVTVVVPGSGRGTTTATDGSYAISAPANGMLQFSFIGMSPVEVPVNNRTTINVVMESDTQFIDEVVVTGYGTQRKASYTGAASIVGEDVIAKKTDANFVKSLEGAIPGLQMSNSTSMPGVWGSVYVRGRGSLNSGTQPLYVIDGMPVNSDTETLSTSYNNQFDPMSAINPSDIESVTVLKDAAATAIYGSRAANGVIVITTKKGTQGKFNLNFETKQGVVSMGNHNMDYANAQETADLFAKGVTARYPVDYPTYESAYDYVVRRFNWDKTSSYDWMDAVTRSGYYQEYNLNVSGRTGQTGYYASLGYLDTEGLVIGSDMERYSGRLNLDSKFKFMTFGATMSYSHSTRSGFSQSTGGSMSNPTVAAVSSMLPFYPFRNEDGSYTNTSTMYNPLAVYDPHLGDINRVTNQTINMSPYLQVDFGKGIYAKTTLGVNISDQGEYHYWSAIYNLQGRDDNGAGMQYNTKNTVITWTNLLGWNYSFNEKHTIGLMLGQEMQKKNRHYEYYEGYDFPFAASGMRDLSTAGRWGDSEYYKSEARLASYFVDGNYSYDDKYYLSGSFRRDGSSVFGSDNRWGNFWSVGAKWRITGEDFLKYNTTVTNAALRASFGTVGNQDIGWYASRGFYSSGYNYNNSAGMVPTAISNPDLTWEISKKFNVGIDLSFINRIHLTVDYYNERTTDALFQVPLSMTTGLPNVMQNIGTIRNRGVEIALNATLMQKNGFTWTAYANMTYNQNRVVKLSTDEPIEGTYTIVEEGRPYRQFYMKEYAGVDRETGKALWYLNAEGNETTSVYNDAAKRYVGSAEPDYVGGFGTSASWKGIDLSVAFNYRLGAKVFDYGAHFTGWGMSFRTPLKDMVYNSWTEENKNAKYPQYIFGDPDNSSAGRSSRFVYSGNFLRISNITLGYTLPEKWVQKAFMQKLRAYVTVDNLYTFTASDFVGYNPDTYTSGYIAWQYPATRTFTAGIQITF